MKKGKAVCPPAPCTPDVHSTGVAGTDFKQKDGPDNKREKMEPGEIGEQLWKREGQEIIHQVPGRGGEKGSQDGEGSMTPMSKRNVVEQRWKGRETRTTRETHQRLKRIANGERSQDMPAGYGFAHW